MKKLITIILALALILPASALAVETDPIIGYWYMFIDCKQYPEFASVVGYADNIFTMYYFHADGSVSAVSATMKDGSLTPEASAFGKWEKESDGNYMGKLFAMGNVPLELKDDTLIMYTKTSPKMGTVLRRIVSFDPYSDYVY